ncbi:hypothetical protein NBRC3293_0786 [Gluconobacter oxydans NBRC 3293]|uniref:Uncharacterized protein n=1 Tax=Gluconobacter oxydans NBRC 3293 TaxID=1315969 RepID=A0A829X3R6_GLUOY|nr:hypothetical protein NBRC3293_0786 [Gluconobacter oxydans NBRC 3293]
MPTAETAFTAFHAPMASAASFAACAVFIGAISPLCAFCDGTSHAEETAAMAATGALSDIRTVCVEAVSLVFEHYVLLFDISNDILS